MSRTRTLGAALITLLFAVFFACTRRDASAPPAADAGAIVDVEVMAFLSEARALHHEANIREDEGDMAGAITVMNRLVTAPRPHPAERVPEVEEVLADAWARVAELHLKTHDLDLAMRAVSEGLARAPEPTYFRGHLLEVEGIIEEARANDFADAGDKAQAEKSRARAIDVLHQAVEVQGKVITRALDGGSK